MQELSKLVESYKTTLNEVKLRCETAQLEAVLQKKYGEDIREQLEVFHQQKLELEMQVKTIANQKFETELELNRKINEVVSMKKRIENENQDHTKKY